ncbi:gliding motility lipoprotein GldH [Flavobacterium sp. SUN052]|uniref:gliding motility lipoprotein GldH n=1 Tax=Flavobacterium sp. SUN052 TaxID=3002441 RepID=UPI00237E7857|nr:gliding motility lipoprotein GldH [Flavobacterium sp. SUN052]MEC4003418.1 gliding motility lipoprotein GldH [Flavobacterium sp. SUN052]
MKIKNSLLIVLVALLMLSCDKKRVFDEYKSVGNAWHKDSIITFKLPKFDASKKYNLFVNVRDNNDYPFDNLFLIVSLEQPNKKSLVDTLEYKMANLDGSLLGDGFSDIKESMLFYKGNVDFKLKGNYKVHIQQAVRQTGKVTGVNDLKGITEVGFRVESLD